MHPITRHFLRAAALSFVSVYALISLQVAGAATIHVPTDQPTPSSSKLSPRWLAAALASPVSAGPQAGTPSAPDAGQGARVTLRGNTRPEAKAMNDRGRVSDDMTIQHLMLQLQRTPEQEQALEQFIKEIHDPTSPLFHHWLTAAEFGQTYGVAPADVAKVTEWLESQGFKVNLVYPNQMVIDFTGTASQIRQAFHTEIHNLLVNGQAHMANMSDPQIPAELGSVVAGVVSLNDFRPQRMLQPRANFTPGTGDYPVVPADLWTIYNFNPAFAAGYSGQGQTIVVIEDSDLYTTADWDTFRSVLGLASAYPSGSLAQVHPPSSPANNCNDPGYNGDDDEAAADVEWASAGAPDATIELASCLDTETNFGGFIALQNLLNASDTPPAIVSVSYGESESLMGAAFNAYTNSLYQQAVTEGVSVFVSSGDAGAAASDLWAGSAQAGININGFTSTPYNVSVGGTDFADTYEKNNSTYWSSTNSANYGSALSYIPEIPWNNSCASALRSDFIGVLSTYGSSSLCNEGSDLNTIAGSGGPSGCATGAPDVNGLVGGTCAGYAKPPWQSGFIGNPNDGVRDIPDVSLFASNAAWGHDYLVCFSDPNNDGKSCSGTPGTWSGYGGTSFSAPIMAAIQSLVNQASASRWGNPNPAYYSLAAGEYGSGGSTSCNSALGSAVATNCIFYDVTQIPLIYRGSGTGGDIDVPCNGQNCYLPSGAYGVLSTAPQALTYAYVPYLGSGYTSAPSCTLSGGGGSGAACSATLTGRVSSVTLTNPGSGYVPTGTTCTLTGGGGTGASCGVAITIPAGQETGFIAWVFITSFGSGYASPPTCTISGGGGTGATCTATKQIGPVVSLTAGGSGYTTLPHCVLSGGGGTGATCAALAFNTSDNDQPAFGAGTGWDFATGIGSVNVSNLVATFLSSSATLSTSSLAFPPQVPFTSSTAQSVTVTNTGTANLAILAVTISGANASDFARSADTCTGATLAPNGTCKVSVTFTPIYVGNRSASLNFTDIAPHSPQTVTLTGTGVGAGVGLSPTFLTFSDQTPGTSSTAQTVTLTNTGNIALSLGPSPLGIAITGSNSSEFSQTNNCGASLNAGANCAIQVTFKPAAAGSKSAALAVTDNALESPQTVGLTGTSAIPIPFINQPLVPTSVSPGGPEFTLTVNGTGFAPGASVNWNGITLATTFVSIEELTAPVPAANTASAGTAAISVANAGSALISNVAFFPVSPPTTTVTFRDANGSPVAAGSSPRTLAAGDFNGDGKLDLAVVNAGSNNLTILLGNGDGTLTPAASSPATGTSPWAVTTGDFNGDGKLDLAVVNFDSDNVTILLGNGNGTFTPAASPSAGNGPNSIAVGDFNGDGKLDLAVVNQGNDNLTILLGNGDGTFTPAAASPATGTEPVGVAVGDFNGDGKLDLAVVNLGSNSVTILLGNGDGTFTPVAASPATENEPLNVAVGDFNRDGNLDLAVGNYSSDTVTILLGNGDGTFTPVAASPATGDAPLEVAVGDFNGDGKLDLAVVNENSNTVTILLGNGDGTFTPTASSPATGAAPEGVVVGDFNGDGTLDLATANNDSNNASVLLQSPPIRLAAVSPGNLTFGKQNVGTASGSLPVTLSNSGNAPLNISGITTSSNFGETNACGSSVAASNSCTINVTFAPTATGTLTGTLTITDNSNGVAGSAQTVTLSGTGTPAPLVITASSASMTYGGAVPTITPSYSGFVNGDTPASLATPPNCTTTATSQSPVGSYRSTCAGAVDPNYNFTYVPGNVTVGKASLTITASNATVTYGGTPPTVTPGYSAFAGTDTVASLTTAPTCTTTATSSTPVGTDTGANTCAGAVDGNYNFTYVPGNMTVSKATPTITWATPASITSGTALSSTQLNATASAPGTFVYNPAAGTTPAAGMDTLSVTFTPTDTGDYNTATATVTLAVTDFTFAPPSGSSTSATVVPGAPATYTLSVSGEGGLSGTVTFTCTGAPSEAACTVSPNPATAGSSPTNVTINVTTTAPSASAPRSRPLPPVPPLRPGLPGLWMLALAMAGMAGAIMRRKQPGVSRWQSAIIPLAAGLLLTLALAGCGGGGSGGTGPSPNPGTPAGTYTLTVTATTGSGSSTLTHTMTLTLIVS
jgi:hypothetical protein